MKEAKKLEGKTSSTKKSLHVVYEKKDYQFYQQNKKYISRCIRI
jgi:hypothetical protein